MTLSLRRFSLSPLFVMFHVGPDSGLTKTPGACKDRQSVQLQSRKKIPLTNLDGKLQV